MPGFIEALLRSTRQAVERRKHDPLPERAHAIRSLSAAIRRVDKAIIAEIKPRSPSAGDLLRSRDAIAIAHDYAAGGAAALSVLIAPAFGGAVETVSRVRRAVTVPVLYKEFITDEFQIWEAFSYGADAVLLIEGISPVALLMNLVDELGMEAIVECHTAEDIDRAVAAGAELVGINNRDLSTFTVDLETTARLAELVPGNKLMISESGVKTPSDASYLFDCGADALLIGTALMEARNPKEFIHVCMT
ncbi:MAG TPA: indole-3-glycerol-phosphate synthase [Methanomicrobia archaeon]|nr:indole-3-glycerol-phosphate synthase [Methanomicrobia archaeon]